MTLKLCFASCSKAGFSVKTANQSNFCHMFNMAAEGHLRRGPILCSTIAERLTGLTENTLFTERQLCGPAGGSTSWPDPRSCSRCTGRRRSWSSCQDAAGGGCCHCAEAPPCRSGSPPPNARPHISPRCAAVQHQWSHATASSRA